MCETRLERRQKGREKGRRVLTLEVKRRKKIKENVQGLERRERK